MISERENAVLLSAGFTQREISTQQQKFYNLFRIEPYLNPMRKVGEWVDLTDEDRQNAFESMPDMLDGFLKKWGWLHFSNAIEAKLKEKNNV